MINPNFICPDCGSGRTFPVDNWAANVSKGEPFQCRCVDCDSMFWVDVDEMFDDVRAALGDVEKLVEDIKQRMENDDWKRVPIDGPPPICPSCRWGNTIPTGEPGRFKCRNCNHEFTFPNHVNCRCYHTPPEKLKKILEENPEWAVSANCGTPIGRTWLDNFFDDTEQYLKNERDKHVKKNH